MKRVCLECEAELMDSDDIEDDLVYCWKVDDYVPWIEVES